MNGLASTTSGRKGQFYHQAARLPDNLPAAAPLTAEAFPFKLGEARDGWGANVSFRYSTDQRQEQPAPYAFYSLENPLGPNPGSNTTYRAGLNFMEAVSAARELSEARQGDGSGAIAILQAKNGPYYLSKPTMLEDETGSTLRFSEYDKVRPESLRIKAMVDTNAWVDLRD